MRRPIYAPQAVRTHLLLAYQATLAEHKALVAKEQQLLDEIEAQKINVEADNMDRNISLDNGGVEADGRGDGLTTQYGRIAQVETSSMERHLLRMSLELINGGRASGKHGNGEPLIVHATRMQDLEPLLYMVKVILGCEPEMQRLKREAEHLQRDIEAYLAVSLDEEELASEDFGQELGKELVDLNQWPLPPRRSEWVLHGERKMKNTKAR